MICDGYGAEHRRVFRLQYHPLCGRVQADLLRHQIKFSPSISSKPDCVSNLGNAPLLANVTMRLQRDPRSHLNDRNARDGNIPLSAHYNLGTGEF